MDYALDVCNAVLDVWKPVKENKAIINIPTTVQIAMPHVFASQVEYFHKNLKYRENVVLSVHPHNDRGCGVSDAELGVLAGALTTAVLQSSSATTVMAIGFVSAGLMSLPQAISIILGANIGTTMTAQIIAFKISDYIYLIVFLGFAMAFVSK